MNSHIDTDVENRIRLVMRMVRERSIQNDGFVWHRQKEINWHALEADTLRYLAGLPQEDGTICQTLTTMNYALRHIGDGHSYVMHPDFYQGHDGTYHPVMDNIRQMQAQTTMPEAERLGNIIHLKVPRFTSQDSAAKEDYIAILHEALDKAAKDSVTGVVVDLRENNGGDPYPNPDNGFLCD